AISAGETSRDREALEEKRAAMHVKYPIQSSTVDDGVLGSLSNNNDMALDIEVTSLRIVLACPRPGDFKRTRRQPDRVCSQQAVIRPLDRRAKRAGPGRARTVTNKR